MSKTVVISLGKGSLGHGFPHVAARLWTEAHPRAEQIVGSLPPAPALIESYRIWQASYRALSSQLTLRSLNQTTLNELDNPSEDELEIDPGGVTQGSQRSFETLSWQLKQMMNDWLDSDGLRAIEQQLRSQLNPTDKIRVIFETDSDLLRRLPWHCWDFFQDYPHAEMALSQLAYQRRELTHSPESRDRVRILAIVGDSRGIDVEPERQALQSLPDAEVTFLVGPSRQVFDRYLWDRRGWDILFFAGHSQTEGRTGRLYINEEPANNSLTIEQLDAGLRNAIARGLQLAVFNSCDGVGLAQAIAQLQIPQVIVMREPVPNRVAQTFLQYFLSAFAAEKLSLYPAVRQARGRLQGLEDEFPGASWLPVLCQNPAAKPFDWVHLGGQSACPYQGLSTFKETDAHLFFGRESVIQDLLTAVTQKPFVAVMGSSGSGKSSVVFAGLLPQLRQSSEDWQIVSLRPGSRPLESLAEALISHQTDNEENVVETEQTRLEVLELAVRFQHDNQALCDAIATQNKQNSGQLLLVIDQFEELYTLCPVEDQQPFLELLLNAVQLAPTFTLLLTLRADFFDKALSNRQLSDALQSGGYNLGPMNEVELEQAIVKPAAKQQVTLEPGLTNQLVQATVGRPGRLPLLEFALTELWTQQKEDCLTYQAYQSIGGVEKALANHAEAAYKKLSSSQQRSIQQIFVQLVEPGSGSQATRRIAGRDEVGNDNWTLVSELASARLVVTSRNHLTKQETVEIIHEALISSWGRLVYWLQVDGDFRRWQEVLRQTRRQWENNEQEEAGLLRGKSLTIAKDWKESRLDELSSADRQFIEKSEAAQNKLAQRQKRKRRLSFTALCAGMLVTSSLTAIAWWGSRRAQLNEVRATIAASDALFTSDERLDALVAALTATKGIDALRWVDSETQNEADTMLRQAVSRLDERNRLLGHEEGVSKVVFSPDGRFIVSSGMDRTIKLWQPDGKLLTTIDAHSSEIWGLAISPDGQTIATASDDKTVKLWRTDGTLLETLTGHTAAVNAVTFSPDGQMIATASQDGFVQIWRRDGELIKRFEAHAQQMIDVITFSPDGQRLATGGGDGLIKLWNSDGAMQKVLAGHTDTVRGLAFSPDGETLASSGIDGIAQLWQISDGSKQVIDTFSPAWMYAIAFSPNGQHIVSSSDERLRLWRRDGTPLSTFQGHVATVVDVAFSPDGKTLASASMDGTIRIWQWNNPLLTDLNAHRDAVWDVAFSADDQLIASASADKTIKLWRPDGTLIRTLKGHTDSVYSLAFSPDGQFLVSGSKDKTTRLWRLDGSLISTLLGHEGWISDVAVSPDSQTIASASSDGTLKLWQRSGELIATLSGHTSDVDAVAFSPDGQLIGSASADRTVRLWKRNGNSIMTLKGHTAGVRSVAFSPDGQTLASASIDKTVRLWRRDGTFIKALEKFQHPVFHVAFSPDSRYLALSSEDVQIQPWQSAGLPSATFPSGRGWASDTAFSRNWENLATTQANGTVSLWSIEAAMRSETLVELGCQQIQEYLQNSTALDSSKRSLCE